MSTVEHTVADAPRADGEVPAPVVVPPAPVASRSPRAVHFRLWPAVYPAAVCQAVSDDLGTVELYDAEVQTSRGAVGVVPDQRLAVHTFIEPAHWAGALVHHLAHESNATWNLDVSRLGTLSFIRYVEGGHFDWHVDVLSYEDHQDEERKLSVTVNLSDPTHYVGGDLEFRAPTGEVLELPSVARQRGSVVVFPSTLAHRVTPVTHGTREVLVGWLYGPPLR